MASSKADPEPTATNSVSAPLFSPAPALGEGTITPKLVAQLQHLTIPAQTQREDEIAASPLLTVPVLAASAPMQHGLIGACSSSYAPEQAQAVSSSSSSSSTTASMRQRLSARIFQNVTAPSSTFICGSQGSGKSNTLACLLENCLLPSPLGSLPHPLTGIVFNYDSFNSDVGGLPCEAAYLASADSIEVRILCAPTNVRTIAKVYRNVPKATIEPLQLADRDLNTERMLDLMAVGESSTPLYMHVVNRVLRELRLEQQATNAPFSYEQFKRRMDLTELTAMQANPLKQRLDTLESFMAKKTKGGNGGNDWTTKPRRLTIVDLSCPCVTPGMACLLFNIALHLFLEGDKTTGRVVALDEAHKYMRDVSGGSRTLTEKLLQVIRVQRHQAVRVIISTQEPTVSPKLLDLCSVTVVHRFTSPAWMQTLQGHLAGLSPMAALVGDTNGTADGEQQQQKHWREIEVQHGAQPIDLFGNDAAKEMFSLIVGLKTGQALVFSPSSIVGIKDGQAAASGSVHTKNRKAGAGAIERLGHRALLVDIRTRLTEDGGRSIMAL